MIKSVLAGVVAYIAAFGISLWLDARPIVAAGIGLCAAAMAAMTVTWPNA